jgi:hypothetical protein
MGANESLTKIWVLFGPSADITLASTTTPSAGVMNMSQLLERPRPRHRFSSRDILSQMGETICLSSHVVEPPARKPVVREIAIPAPVQVVDEDPERWDGLS